MHRIIYLSSSVNFMEKTQLEELLEKSRFYNASKNISGVLAYIDGDFIQVLEGEKEDVITLFKKIENDSRHRTIICVSNEAIKQKQFPNWSMGFCVNKYDNLSKIKSLENFNRNELFNSDDKKVLVFLKIFFSSHETYTLFRI